MAYIIADDRENNGAIDYLEICIENNNNKNVQRAIKNGGGEISFQIKRCTVGDYMIVLPSKYIPNHHITAIVIERKTWADLSASIKDFRCSTQHLAMKQFRKDTGAQIYYIIEGDAFPNDNDTPSTKSKTTYSQLGAKIRQNSLRGVHYFQTKNQMGTAKMLVDLARDCMKLYNKGEMFFPLQEYNKVDVPDLTRLDFIYELNNPYLLNEIDKWKYKLQLLSQPLKLENITHSKLSKPKVMVPEELELKMWSQFKKVGNTTAIILRSKFDIRKIFDITEQDLDVLCYDSGKKFSSPIKTGILTSINDVDIHEKMLACITGITNTVARFILTNVSLKQIMEGNFNIKELSELKFKGNKIAAKIQKIKEVLCPDYIEPKIKLPKDSMTYLFLQRYGDPDELYHKIKDLQVSSTCATFIIDGENPCPDIWVEGYNEIEY